MLLQRKYIHLNSDTNSEENTFFEIFCHIRENIERVTSDKFAIRIIYFSHLRHLHNEHEYQSL